MLSVTITDRSGRTLSGQTIDAFWVSVAHARPLSVGINCALGAREMRPYLAELARVADTWISCYPNAGLPNAFGELRRAARGDRRAAAGVRRRAASSTCWAAAAAPRRTTSARWPRRWRTCRRAGLRKESCHGSPSSAAVPGSLVAATEARKETRCFSGLERARRLTVPPTATSLMIGERTNVTGSRRFANGSSRRTTTPPRPTSRSTRCAAAPTSSTSTWTRACSTPRRR